MVKIRREHDEPKVENDQNCIKWQDNLSNKNILK